MTLLPSRLSPSLPTSLPPLSPSPPSLPPSLPLLPPSLSPSLPPSLSLSLPPSPHLKLGVLSGVEPVHPAEPLARWATTEQLYLTLLWQPLARRVGFHSLHTKTTHVTGTGKGVCLHSHAFCFLPPSLPPSLPHIHNQAKYHIAVVSEDSGVGVVELEGIGSCFIFFHCPQCFSHATLVKPFSEAWWEGEGRGDGKEEQGKERKSGMEEKGTEGWRNEGMEEWRYEGRRDEEWKDEGMVGWRNGDMEEWDGEIEGWRDGGMEEWKNGEMGDEQRRVEREATHIPPQPANTSRERRGVKWAWSPGLPDSLFFSPSLPACSFPFPFPLPFPLP